MPEIVSTVIDMYPFRRVGTDVQFLLLRRAAGTTLAGTWQVVHGGIEVSETAWEAALREMREETGLHPDVDSDGRARFWQIDFVNSFYVAAQDRILMCPCFTAEVRPDTSVSLSHEHDGFRWEAPDAAARLLPWPGQRVALEEVMSAIVVPGTAEPFCRISIKSGGLR